MTAFSLLWIFVGSAFATWALGWALLPLAKRWQLFAKQDLRRQHDRKIPLLGGTIFYLVLVIAGCIAVYSGAVSITHPAAVRFGISLALSITLIYFVGILDDLKELKAPAKFAAQFAAATMVVTVDGKGWNFVSILDSFGVPAWISLAALVFWVVGVTNAFNMIDGLDGLCTGVAALCGVALVLSFLSSGSEPTALTFIIVASVGFCAGFLIHNYHPARMFLGDSGSLLLGFILAVASVRWELKRPALVSMSVPLFLLGLPMLDVALAVTRRVSERRNPFKGDRGHLHHRLQRIGLGHKGTVHVLWGVTAYFNTAAFLFSGVPAEFSLAIYASFIPGFGFLYMALFYIENRLSSQVSRFGAFYLEQELTSIASRKRVLDEIEVRISRSAQKGLQERFIVAVFDTRSVLTELINKQPGSVINFFSKLYGVMMSSVRDEDFVGRWSENRTVAIFPIDAGQEASQCVPLRRLASEVRKLQESYLIFQPQPFWPQGFQFYVCPMEFSRVLRDLRSEGEPPPSEKVAA